MEGPDFFGYRRVPPSVVSQGAGPPNLSVFWGGLLILNRLDPLSNGIIIPTLQGYYGD